MFGMSNVRRSDKRGNVLRWSDLFLVLFAIPCYLRRKANSQTAESVDGEAGSMAYRQGPF
jgi:hypothetical protein